MPGRLPPATPPVLTGIMPDRNSLSRCAPGSGAATPHCPGFPHDRRAGLAIGARGARLFSFFVLRSSLFIPRPSSFILCLLAVFGNRQVTGIHTWRAGRASQKAKGKGQMSKCPEAESATNETVPGAGQAGFRIVSPFPGYSPRILAWYAGSREASRPVLIIFYVGMHFTPVTTTCRMRT